MRGRTRRRKGQRVALYFPGLEGLLELAQNDCPCPWLVCLWSAYTRHLSHVIESHPPGSRNVPCDIGKEQPVTLEFVATDYVRQGNHHLKDIVGRPQPPPKTAADSDMTVFRSTVPQ